MDFALSEEQRAFQEMARQYAEDVLAKGAAHWDEAGIFPVDALRQAAALGLATIYVDPAYDGSGLTRLDAALIFEELARADPSTAAYISIHNMVAWMIDRFGDEALKTHWLPKLATMELFASYCLTEPGSGSDASSLRTTAKRDGDVYVLNGQKAFISGGSASGLYAVMARTGETGPGGVSCILVEGCTPGLSFGKKEAKMGWNSQPTTAVMFEDCRVPASNRLGSEGEGFKIAMRALDGGRINIAACSLGAAAHCLDQAKAYAKERKQFGQAIAEFQAIQFKLADMATELEAARLMTHRAAALLDAGDPGATQACAMAKRFATDAGFGICNDALQVHGGYGYIKEYGIERYVRDCRVHQILEGTNEIMRLIIARRLLAE